MSKMQTHTPISGKTPRATRDRGERLVRSMRQKYYDEHANHEIPSLPWRLGSKPQQGKMHLDIYVLGHLNEGNIFEPWTNVPVEITRQCNYDKDPTCMIQDKTQKHAFVCGERVDCSHDGNCGGVRYKIMSQVESEIRRAVAKTLERVYAAIQDAVASGPRTVNVGELGCCLSSCLCCGIGMCFLVVYTLLLLSVGYVSPCGM